MLLRAAGRRRPLHWVIRSAAQARWTSSSTSNGTRLALAAASPPSNRHDTVPPHVRTHASIAGPSVETSSPYQMDHTLSASPTFNWAYTSSESPLITIPPTYEPPPARRSVLGHTTADLLQNLFASLRVNRFDRAENIIKRMSATEETTDAEYMYACELYLGHRTQTIAGPPGYKQNMIELEAWFKERRLHQRKEGSERACLHMVKAALVDQDPSKRDARVKKWAEMSGLSTEDIVANSLWTDREYLVVGAILNGEPIPDLDQVEPAPLEEEDAVPAQQHRLAVDDIPQVLQVQQRGLGLKLLKQVLNMQEGDRLANQPAEPLDAQSQILRDLERERLIENASKDAAVEKWKAEAESLRAVGINSALSSRKINALMYRWYSDLVPVLRAELASMKQRLDEYDSVGREAGREPADSYAIYLENISPEKLAVITLIHMVSSCCAGKDVPSDEYQDTNKVADATKSLGEHVEAEVVAQMLSKERSSKWYLKQMRRNLSSSGSRLTPESPITNVRWPTNEKVKIGAMLISKFFDTAKMPVTRQHPRTKEMITRMRPAFVHRNIFAKGKRTAVLGPCSELRAMLVHEPAGALISKKLPMVVEPVPWSAFRTGGYLNYPDNFVRMPLGDETPRDYAKAAIEKGHMDQVFNAITALGKTPWCINRDVLRVQIEAWNKGEAIANFPPLNPTLEYPPEPPASTDPHARAKWVNDVRSIDNKIKGWHSQRCHQNLQLEIARSFKDDKIYFPHNVDFRGRAYPLPPYLNHMGADNVRALMNFASGKELGPNGLRWLKIQLANVFGYDKDSFNGREEFVDSHLDDIYDSVKNPLDGKRWWLKSDDPWQTLAACYELVGALDSPDPAKYVSHLPIQQDGTCNGLQHYAALGGDAAGARQVNLEPGDKPSDVYTAVADSVIASIKKDLAEGNQLAKMLDGKITRKVVKQPVMTNVYGVTYYGARQQVQKQLEDIFPNMQRSDFPNHTTLASYIARKIFNSLGEMFKGAQAIQDWLGLCADRISTCVTPEQIAAIKKESDDIMRKKAAGRKVAKARKSSKLSDNFKTTVVWTTPLQFPVVQPYRDSNTRPLTTAMSSITIQEPRTWDPVSKRKQMQAFPPNFIHSLDATHMMLSAMKCDEKGIMFASIHDSFWTHACDREELSELLRDAFVHMHRENIIGRLKEEFDARYKGCMWMTTIRCSKDLATRLSNHRKGKAYQLLAQQFCPGVPASEAEVIVEQERLRLLNSSDPAEQAEGASMVTPASIFAEEGNNGFIETPDLGDTRLGAEVPPEDMLEYEPHILRDSTVVIPSKDLNLEAADIDRLAEAQQDPEKLNELLGTWVPPRPDAVAALVGGVKAWVWQPISFPDTPDKGTFDVTRLKQSKYFFH